MIPGTATPCLFWSARWSALALGIGLGDSADPEPAAWAWKPLLASDLLLMLLTGGLGTSGLLCLTCAFTRLEASRVAPLEYSSFVWAAGLGDLLFGEVPTLTAALSAALIVGGRLLLLRRRLRR